MPHLAHDESPGIMHTHGEGRATGVARCKWRLRIVQGLLTAPGPTMLNVRDVALAHLRAAELPHASGQDDEAMTACRIHPMSTDL